MGLFSKKSRAMNDTQLFITQSINGMREQQAVNVATWQLNSPDSTWGVDMQTGKITFTFPDKVVTADVQIVGTLHNGEFMWGWNHPSVPPTLGKAANLAKKWGEENNRADYTTQLVNASEDKAWEFTAVAARLIQSTGTYRGQNGDAWVYMTFGPVTMTKR